MTKAAALAAAQDLKVSMESWGVRCSIELQEGRGGDPWAVPTKYHRMHHHTVSRYVEGGNMTPVLWLCKAGRSDVPGPLCNGYGGYDLVYRIICMGLANHPGQGGPITIDGVHIPEDSARTPTWGTEWEGGYQDWADIPGMLEFMGRADCALAEWTGRPITSQMEHKTWAPTRKIDRLNFTRDSGIALSRRYLDDRPPGGDDMPSNDEILALVRQGVKAEFTANEPANTTTRTAVVHLVAKGVDEAENLLFYFGRRDGGGSAHVIRADHTAKYAAPEPLLFWMQSINKVSGEPVNVVAVPADAFDAIPTIEAPA